MQDKTGVARITVLMWLLVFTCSLSAQSTSIIEGRVWEKSSREPLAGVSICLYPLHGNDLLSFAISQADGAFRLRIPATGDSLRVELSCMGFKKEIYPVGPPFNQTLTVEMTPETFVLREVLVRAPEMSLTGDTVRYYLPAYAGVEDRSIGDVLRHLPGISVGAGGQIRYQGEAISHLYIENRDLMGRGYGVAVRNLPAEAFSVAEVLEHHQSVQVLQNREFSSQAAINLKLKDAYKSTWMFTADAGAGVWPLLWSARLMGAQFSGNWQSLHLYKSNNMGEEVARELLTFGSAAGVIVLQPSEGQNLFAPANTPPPVSQSRSLFNHSQMVATNHLTGLGKDLELRMKANYLFDREESNRSVATTYYLPNTSDVIINESFWNERKTDQWGLELTVQANTKAYFLEDKVEIKGEWNSMRSLLFGVLPLEQHFNLPKVALRNDFTWMKRLGARVVKLGSELAYNQLPQSLSVWEGDVREGEQPASLRQEVGLRDLQASVAAELQERIGKWNLTLNTGVRLGNRHLTSELTGMGNALPELALSNDTRMLTLEPYLEPGAQFNLRRDIQITSKFPICYHWSQTALYHRFYVSPSLSANWTMSSNWELRGAYRRETTLEGVSLMHTGYIMRNYRQFDQGLDHLPYRLRNSYSLSLTYRSAMGLMAFLRGGYSSGFRNYLSHRELIDIYMFSRLYEKHTPSNLLTATLGITKRFPDLRLTAGLSLGHNVISTEVVQQNVPVYYQNNSWSLTPRLALNFAKNSQIEYNAMLSSNNLVIRRSEQKGDPLRQLQHSLKTTVAFSSRIYAQVSAEHYANETVPGSYTQGVFGDAALSLSYKKVQFRLDLKNIFNHEYYTRASYREFSSVVYSWKLRPREFCVGASWSL
ncbi:MAG: TonB-dependent receptor [Bacteroidales bacterium]|nr:TonB-dependent receptor [Bacteroidales bacterium]